MTKNKSGVLAALAVVAASAGVYLVSDNPAPVPAFSPESDLSRTSGTPDKRWYGVYTQYLANDRVQVDVDAIAKVVADYDDVMAEIDSKAPLDSPLFTGNPTVPTPDLDDDSNSIATAGLVHQLTAGMVTDDDDRLSNARPPISHAFTHSPNGSDPISWPVASDTALGITRGDGTTIQNNPDGTLSSIRGEYEWMPPAPNDGKIYGATGYTWVESGGEGNIDHSKLTPASRNLADQHPIAAITGLQTELNAKAAASHVHTATEITSGTLPIARGGTGNTTGLAASAMVLATARTFRTNLGSTSTASFNGSANVTPGVTGILSLANGGTGGSTAVNARTALGVSYSASLATNGYYILPGGLIIQWGRATVSAGAGTTVTFPIAFTAAVYSVSATPNRTESTSSSYVTTTAVEILSLTQMQIRSGGTNMDLRYWMAIGR